MKNSGNTTDRDSANKQKKEVQRREAHQREACVNRDATGDPLGCAVFLTATNLRELDVDPETLDRVAYCVTNGEIQFTPPSREVTDE